ncbi:MAG: GT4 family glycosyltransferase PelF [Sulfuriferula sp.]|nr:GT4 family glycosyltransferase PelF [Sulfuriferula sp.]
MTLPTATDADIALLLEGTFPYISGGVSSWVNQIIRAYPEYRFAVVFLGSRPQDYGDIKYVIPDNVIHVETHYLHGGHTAPLVQTKSGDDKVIAQVTSLHKVFRASQGNTACAFAQMAELLKKGEIDEEFFLYSQTAWQFITQNYREHCTDPSFIDYFWTVRAMHEPIWVMTRIAANLIPVRAFHTISTGYAGFLGAMLKNRTGKPLILSEHGIYTKERKIDLYQSSWITDNRNIFEKDPTEVSYFRELWMRFYTSLGKLCYHHADIITSLYEANRQRQVLDGAPAELTRVIPNGIDLARFQPVRAKRPATPPPILCLIGRVVPIKDVKTFIRMMRTVVNRIPEAEAWIAGPEDEDAGYAEECHNLCESLGLTDKVKFLGFQKVEVVLEKVGLVVLSSISEALPLVLLEGYAAGVPALTTDVGSCRQLIYGLTPEDQALGASGAVVRIADPQAMATAAIELLRPENWFPAQQAAIARVERYYTQTLMFDDFKQVYQQAMGEI